MKISEKKVIDKIIALAKSAINTKIDCTNEIRLTHAISNCNQIIAICELLEFDQEFDIQSKPIQCEAYTPETMYTTPSEITDIFKEALKEQVVHQNCAPIKFYEK